MRFVKSRVARIISGDIIGTIIFTLIMIAFKITTKPIALIFMSAFFFVWMLISFLYISRKKK